MSNEFDIKRERIYAVIAIICFISTNVFIYLDDQSIIIGFLLLELILIMVVAICDWSSFWISKKLMVKRDSSIENYWIIILMSVFYIVLYIFSGRWYYSPSVLFFGIWVMTIAMSLGIVIARQIYILRHRSDITDFEQSTEAQTDS